MNYLQLTVDAVFLMWALYIIGIQYLRGGWWRVLVPVAALALALDLVLNYTLFAVLMLAWPREGVYTFSRRLSRLKRATGWRKAVAVYVSEYLLDPFDPSGRHVV